MEKEAFLSYLEDFMIENNLEFMNFALKEQVTNFLEQNSKYAKLVEWLDSEIEFYKNNMVAFNPSLRNDDYINAYFKNYDEACKNIAMLLNLRFILVNKHCTNEMRENIEYTICKVFNVHYNDNLEAYV